MSHSTFSLQDLAHIVQGECIGQSDLILSGLASLEYAQKQHISFVNAEKYREAAIKSQAGALIVSPDLQQLIPSQQNFIVVANPYLAFAMLTHVFEKKQRQFGIEATAQIHPSAIVSEDAYIGHYVVIGENCVVAEGTVIQSHVRIDDNVEIGKDCFIDSHVTLTGAVKIGQRVRIHANTVIGSEGFGFAPYQGKWHRIAQLGSVQIHDDVRIGSNCSVDRGALDDTILEQGVILDNLVQIAHNAHLGAHTAIAANTAVAGSTKIGKNCIVGGGSAIAGHLIIADNVILTGMSMVTNNISEAGKYSSGIGLFENQRWKRTVVRLRQLADVPLTQLTKKLDDVQARLESIESTFNLRK